MKKILLLEDNLTDIDLVKRELLNRWPEVELKIAKTLSDARKLINTEEKFDVALFDLNLPDGNGMDLLSELRHQNNETPIIIFTSVGSEEIATASLKAGANDYIPKKPGYQDRISSQIEFTLQQLQSNRQHLSVLYIEHHQSDIDLTKHYLRQFAPHIHLSILTSGERVLDILPENNDLPFEHDLILLDYRLPGLNALEICKIIRQERKLAVALVIVTGQGDEKIAVEALKLGVDDYIVKQSNYLIRLPSVIMSAFRRRELERQKEIIKISETKYRLLADYAADWEFWINPQGEFVYISPICEQITGYPPEAFEKNKDLLSEITHPLYRDDVSKHFTSMSESILHKPYEFIIICADGEEKWITHICRAVYDEENKYMGQRGVNRDITDRKKSEIALRESESHLRSVFEAADDVAFITTDLGGQNTRILSFSKGAEKIFGYKAEEILGQKVALVHPSEVEVDFPAMQENLKKNEKGYRGEAIMRRKSGELFPALFTIHPFYDDNGKVNGTLGVTIDITERKKNEQDLIKALKKATESDRLKSAFLANMSHEIRTPMNGIIGFTGLLKTPNLERVKQLHHIDIIQQSSTRLLGIIDDLMNISKIEAGQLEISISKVNINDQLDQLYAFFEPEAIKKGLKLFYKKPLPDEEVFIETDSIKFYGIFSNLIKNAIKYSNEGSIEFGYTSTGSVSDTSASSVTEGSAGSATGSSLTDVQFYVKDTGIGIPKDRLKAIFDRFVQADIEDKEARQGAGLGLSIAKAYVEMLGGRIWVESESGKGSQFYFTIHVK